MDRDCTVSRAVIFTKLIHPRLMYAADYQKELAINTPEKRVPTLLAFLMIATLGSSLWLAYVVVKSHFTQQEQAISGK